MIYNPIFEEEIESKVQLKQLKKEIKKRAREESMKDVLERVYNLLKRKPILTIAAILHPIADLLTPKTKEV